jgi:hypothetical protein
VFRDAIVVKVCDGQVANRPVCAAIGVTLGGEKDVLGLWAGTGGEGAKFWMSVLTDLRNHGVKDAFFVVCDGLKGLPDVVASTWPRAIVQTCIVHYADVGITCTSYAMRSARSPAAMPPRSPLSCAGSTRPRPPANERAVVLPPPRTSFRPAIGQGMLGVRR